MQNSKKRGEKTERKWLSAHFVESSHAYATIVKFVNVCEGGIGCVTSSRELVDAVVKIEKIEGTEEAKKRIEEAEEAAAFAKSEADNDFPVLHNFAVVAIWSWLEHFIKKLIAEYLLHDKSYYSHPSLQKIKIKLGDFVKLQGYEQAYYVTELLDQEVSGQFRHGVSRFESLLEPFSINGKVPKEHTKTFIELQQIRNAIVHHNSKANSRLCTTCPWLNMTANQNIFVSRIMLTSYHKAVTWYFGEIANRAYGVHSGRDDS